MPNNAQTAILAAFHQATGSSASTANKPDAPVGLLPGADEGLTTALTQATQVMNTQTQATSNNTDALAQNSAAKSSSSGGNQVASVVSTVSQLLGGGLSMMPLVSLFAGLFGGGSPQQPAPLTPYSLPPSLNLESTTNYQDISWGEGGLPRAAKSSTATPAQQITVQVQALDSQSFLDHSNDIAQAVRLAMLNMNSLNDFVTSL